MLVKCRAYAASQAIELVYGYNFDAVLIDIHMPDESGMTLIRKSHRLESSEMIAILAITITNSKIIKQQGQKASAASWVLKPVSPRSCGSVMQATQTK